MLSKLLTGKSTGKRSLGRSRRTSEEYIRIDLKEIDVKMRNWMDLTKDDFFPCNSD